MDREQAFYLMDRILELRPDLAVGYSGTVDNTCITIHFGNWNLPWIYLRSEQETRTYLASIDEELLWPGDGPVG